MNDKRRYSSRYLLSTAGCVMLRKVTRYIQPVYTPAQIVVIGSGIQGSRSSSMGATHCRGIVRDGDIGRFAWTRLQH